MTFRRMLRLATAIIGALVLTACAGLPTSGPVNNGSSVGDAQTGIDFIPRATGPIAGASPQQLVEGFIEAAISPGNDWDIAQQFLTEAAARDWDPGAAVTIDASATSREFHSDVRDTDDDAVDGAVEVKLTQVASVDAAGQYSESVGTTELPFRLHRGDDGEWRIAELPDGVVLDQGAFQQVFNPYPLQYFDQRWSQLVPDVRWYPVRSPVATRIARAIVETGASEWLQPSVRSAFPAEVGLAKAAVPVDGQIAEVELTEQALGLDVTTLARMRTQLQESLRPVGISEVRFTVDGRALEAQTVPLALPDSATSTVALDENGLGMIVGGQSTPISGISDQVATIADPIAAIEMARDDRFAVVQLANGRVYAVTVDQVSELGGRSGLLAPSVDLYGYAWTVSASDPRALVVWTADVTSHTVAGAWPEAKAISALRVSADGARVAAIVTIGGRQVVVVAAVVRDENGMPTELGPMREIADIGGGSAAMGWIGADTVGIVIGGEGGAVITQLVGGPGSTADAPHGALMLAGSSTRSGLRVLGANGVLYAPRASVWQEFFSGATVLGTRSGY